MNVKFLQHAGYLVGINDSCFLFDYYRGDLPDFSEYKNLYVFVSHTHYDHYNSDIFLLNNTVDNVYYILSDDVEIGDNEINFKEKEFKIWRAKAKEDFTIDGCRIRTIISTDVGVAFIVSFNGKTIYHAGDMNWWVFPTQEAERNAWVGEVYKREIDALNNMSFDLAFVPVDPTLQDGFYLGIDYFMKHTDTKKVFPMHFWGNFGIYDRLLALPETKSYANRIIKITHFGEEWVID